MEAIRKGMSGVAVEDVQERLARLGYALDEQEREQQRYGNSTAEMVSRFRAAHDLPIGDEVDFDTWSVLVDEGYRMGDRTLYLRLPNFHGNDVRELQTALNILGFSCGQVDGLYGALTESAVKQFQENVGLFADGMAFGDTFDAIERLHHVWEGKPVGEIHPMGTMSFARAASVLEETRLAISAEDPISRNVAGRIWNLASATTNGSGITLIDSVEQASSDVDAIFILSTSEMDAEASVANVVVSTSDNLAMRIHTAYASSRTKPPVIRMELPYKGEYDGSFTVDDAQTLAVLLLDAICLSFAE
ncbi:MAG: peptidoglycan-binding protein [Atopobiaceae bacterium]|nr:peptidoglycan-binding protein [Atopobiaceae bacterium]